MTTAYHLTETFIKFMMETVIIWSSWLMVILSLTVLSKRNKDSTNDFGRQDRSDASQTDRLLSFVELLENCLDVGNDGAFHAFGGKV